MEEYGITDRDAFLAHSMNFDLDENGYLKKAEFVAAAEAFNADDEDSEEESDAEDAPSEEEAAEEEVAVEEAAEEPAPEEQSDEAAEAKDCPICGTSNAHDAGACIACNYTFE